MPNISFNIASGRYANITYAIEAFNVENPSNPATDADDFCKKASIEAIQDYLTRYRNSRLASIASQVETCSPQQWSAVTGILLG